MALYAVPIIYYIMYVSGIEFPLYVSRDAEDRLVENTYSGHLTTPYHIYTQFRISIIMTTIII